MKGKNFQPTNGESSIPNLSTYTETLNHKNLDHWGIRSW